MSEEPPLKRVKGDEDESCSDDGHENTAAVADDSAASAAPSEAGGLRARSDRDNVTMTSPGACTALGHSTQAHHHHLHRDDASTRPASGDVDHDVASSTGSVDQNRTSKGRRSSSSSSAKKKATPEEQAHKALLSAWLFLNSTEPYPREELKQMMCRAMNMKKTQVSNWFTNHRRRELKKCTESSASPEVDATLYLVKSGEYLQAFFSFMCQKLGLEGVVASQHRSNHLTSASLGIVANAVLAYGKSYFDNAMSHTDLYNIAAEVFQQFQEALARSRPDITASSNGAEASTSTRRIDPSPSSTSVHGQGRMPTLPHGAVPYAPSQGVSQMYPGGHLGQHGLPPQASWWSAPQASMAAFTNYPPGNPVVSLPGPPQVVGSFQSSPASYTPQQAHGHIGRLHAGSFAPSYQAQLHSFPNAQPMVAATQQHYRPASTGSLPTVHTTTVPAQHDGRTAVFLPYQARPGYATYADSWASPGAWTTPPHAYVATSQRAELMPGNNYHLSHASGASGHHVGGQHMPPQQLPARYALPFQGHRSPTAHVNGSHGNGHAHGHALDATALVNSQPQHHVGLQPLPSRRGQGGKPLSDRTSRAGHPGQPHEMPPDNAKPPPGLQHPPSPALGGTGEPSNHTPLSTASRSRSSQFEERDDCLEPGATNGQPNPNSDSSPHVS